MDRSRIRPIVICLFRRGKRILVSEAHDSTKNDRYCRPIGGGVEFGEHSRDAMLREIQEELGTSDVKNLKLVGVLESIFHYEGGAGHEIVFVYDAEFCDERIYEKNEVEGYESGIDTRFTANWRSPEELEQMQIRLVPEGLVELLSA